MATTLTTTNPTLFVAADGIQMPNWKKDAFDILDYTLDWSNYIDEGDEIIAVTFITGTGVNLTILSKSLTATTTTAFIQGGSDGETYSVIAQIITEAGREMERTFKITCGPN